MPAWLLVVMVVGAATGVSVLGALVAKVYADTDGFQRMPWEGAESDDDSGEGGGEGGWGGQWGVAVGVGEGCSAV